MTDIVIGDEVIEWVKEQSDEFQDFLHGVGFGIKRDNKLIAGVVFDHFNDVNIQMHVAATNGNWLNRKFLWLCFDYPFNVCKVKRITAIVSSNNEKAIKFDEHLGFKLEATLKDCHVNGDLLIYRMYRHECKWLNLRKFIKYEDIHRSSMSMAA